MLAEAFMLKVLMPSFGANIFGVDPDGSTPTLHLPPVVGTKRGLEFDFTSLLLFDRMILDSLSVEFIQFSGLPAHATLRDSIARLVDAELAEIEEFGELADRHRQELSRMDESEASDARGWHVSAEAAVRTWKAKSPILQLPAGVWNRFSFGICQYMKEHGKPFNESEAARLEELALKKRPSKERTELLNFIAGVYLKQVHLNLILARETKGTVFDWENLSGFYRTKLTRAAIVPEVTDAHILKIRELFNTGMPDYPHDVRHFLRLVQDSRLTDLRGLIEEAVQDNKQLSQDFWLRSFHDLFKSKATAEHLRKRVGWITSPLLLHHLPGHIGRETITEVAGALANRASESHHRWLVMLLENK